MSKIRVIAVIGPECTGKTTLVRQLAAHFRSVVVPEFAREYLDVNGLRYGEADLRIISHGQRLLEETAVKQGNCLIFCDTDPLSVRIWSEIRFGQAHPSIKNDIGLLRGRFYLLAQPDIPWETDPQRENPLDREMIFKLHRNALFEMGAEYAIVEGAGQQRLECALNSVKKHLNLMNVCLFS